MKKKLLFGITTFFVVTCIAQNTVTVTSNFVPIKIDASIANKTLPYNINQQFLAEQSSFGNAVSNLSSTSPLSSVAQTRVFATGTVIGTTGYQLQSNGSICNSIVKSSDGTISATWTWSAETSSWADRGTGYNYFNGTSWGVIPTARVENLRTGFANIGITSSGKEVVIAHDAAQINMTTRSVKGIGAWTDTSLASITGFWPRMCVGGANGKTMHLLSREAPSSIVNGAVNYSRSIDGGLTWDKVKTVIPQINTSFYLGFSGDQYSIDAKGDTIAIVIGGLDNDVILIKSINNGNSWTKIIVKQFPIPLFNSATMSTDINADGIADTIESNDGSVSVLLDNQGKTHVWYGRMRVLEPVGATGLSYFPATDGLMYWNESMAANSPVLIAGARDLNNNGTLDMYNGGGGFGFGTYNLSLTSQPSAGIDLSGNIYLSYSSIFEGLDDQGSGAIDGSLGSHTGKNYRHTYIISSSDGGVTWGAPKDITNPTLPLTEFGSYDYLEAVYGSMAKDIDLNIHLVIQQDGAPGHGVFGSIDPQNSIADIIYYKINVLEANMQINKSNVTCYGFNNGSITVNIVGNFGTLQYSKNGGSTYQSSNVFSGLNAGAYQIVVKDAFNNLTSVQSVTITQPASALFLSSYSASASCAYNNEGVAGVTVSGGTAPYAYSWSNSDTTSSISGLSAGAYSVVVTDFLGCISNKTIIINKDAPQATPSICMVTVDSLSINNEIYWDKTLPEYAFADSVIVFRYDVVSTNYLRIGAVSKNLISMFTDTARSVAGPNGGDPQYSSYRYKLALSDICGNVSALSDYHQSIFIQQSSQNFIWNAYSIGGSSPVSGYQFFRKDNPTAAWNLLVSTVGLATTDPNYGAYPNGQWRVEALGLTCNPTRATVNTTRSNIKHPGIVIGMLENSVLNDVYIYPNPFKEQTKISFTREQKNSSIKIMDVMGKEVKSINFTGKELIIEKEEMQSGIYFLQAETQQGVLSKKLIIIN